MHHHCKDLIEEAKELTKPTEVLNTPLGLVAFRLANALNIVLSEHMVWSRSFVVLALVSSATFTYQAYNWHGDVRQHKSVISSLKYELLMSEAGNKGLRRHIKSEQDEKAKIRKAKHDANMKEWDDINASIKSLYDFVPCLEEQIQWRTYVETRAGIEPGWLMKNVFHTPGKPDYSANKQLSPAQRAKLYRAMKTRPYPTCSKD